MGLSAVASIALSASVAATAFADTEAGYIKASNGAQVFEINPVKGSSDYDIDGDGKADVAYFRPSNGQWFGMKAAGGVAR